MNHADLERDLPWYVNGTLTSDRVRLIDGELPGCANCADEIAEIRTLRDALREDDARAGTAPQALADDVFRRIGEAASETQPSSKVRTLPVRTVAGGAGLAAAAVIALFVSTAHSGSNATAPISAVQSAPGPDSDQSRAKTEDTFQAAPVTAGSAADGASARGPMNVAAPVPKLAVHGADAQAARERKLARTGDISLIVTDVPGALARIDRLAGSEFGTVTGLDDESPSTPGETHTANVTLSVPSDRFEASLDAIAALGGVTSRNVKTEDLTDSLLDTEAHLRNLRHEESDLLRIMDRQGKVGDILDVEQQLASTRESIEQLDAEDKSMEQRVSYSTITIALTDEKHAQVAVPGAGSQIGNAWTHATRLLWAFTLALIAKLLVLAVFAPYLIAFGFVAWFAYRRWLRPRTYRR